MLPDFTLQKKYFPEAESSLGASIRPSGNSQGSDVLGTSGHDAPLINCLIYNQCKYGAGFLPRMLLSSSTGSNSNTIDTEKDNNLRN